MYVIKEVNDKKIWELFLRQSVFYPFFQSWNWGEVQKKLGFNVFRLGIYSSNQVLIGVCQIVEIKARRGHYFHLRHGPVFFQIDTQVFHWFIEQIKKMAEDKRVSFLRTSPLIEKEKIDKNMLKNLHFYSAPIHNMDAEVCWILDITKPEEELLKDMRKSHRYLIRKALQMNLKLIRTTKDSDIERFMPLYRSLSEIKHFVPHKGVKEEFEMFKKDNQEVLYLVEYEKKIIAGALIAFVGNMAIYRHSASDKLYNHIPASYLIQWEAIREAKKRGMKLYNFWGIAPFDKPNHPWQGLTLFKTGFGGEKKEFLHAQDMPLSLLYWKNYVIDFLSKMKKGY